jgi:hypothetical protein
MVRLYENGMIKDEDELVISVRRNVQEYPIKIYVKKEDTIYSLKLFFESRFNAFTDEQNYVIGPHLPYALSDNLSLFQLRDEHCNLFVIIKEAHYTTIPKRYLLTLSEEVEANIGNIDTENIIITTKVLDLRYIHLESIQYIGQWMYMDRYINEIYLLATHPKIDDIIYSISEYILLFPKLYRVHIQHPSDPEYKYPRLHNDRFMDLDNISKVKRDVVMYLYQTLLTDQYREVDDEVEIVLDKYVLGNEMRTTFHPEQ